MTMDSISRQAKMLFRLAQQMHANPENATACAQADAALLALLTRPDAAALSQVMHAFLDRCMDPSVGADVADEVVDRLESLSAQAPGAAGGTHHLFVVPLLVPRRLSFKPLTEVECQQLTESLHATGLLGPGTARLLPRLVPLGSLLELSEWSVFALTRRLAQGQSSEALQTLKDVFEFDEGAANALAHACDSDTLVFEALVGTVEHSGMNRSTPFPLADKVDQLLEQDETPRGVRAALEASQQALVQFNAAAGGVFRGESVEALNEVQGFWQDLQTAQDLVRSVELQRGLQTLLARKGLSAADLLASSNVQFREDSPSVGLALYLKQDITPWACLTCPALPGERPEDCAEAALEFVASQGITLFDDRLLADAQPPEEEEQMSAKSARRLH